MRIDEITSFSKPLETDIKTAYSSKGKAKAEEVKRRLAEQGWTLVGEGYYSMAFMNKRKDTILKINRVRDPAYEHYVNLIKKNPNIHFPKISDKLNITQGWKAYLIERLYPLKNGSMEARFMLDVVHGMQMKNDGVEPSSWTAKCYALMDEMKEKDSTLYAALTILESERPYNFRFDLDGNNNIMQRKDGTLVLSDPYAMDRGNGW